METFFSSRNGTDSRGDILWEIEKDVDGASCVGQGRDAVDELRLQPPCELPVSSLYQYRRPIFPLPSVNSISLSIPWKLAIIKSCGRLEFQFFGDIDRERKRKKGEKRG